MDYFLDTGYIDMSQIMRKNPYTVILIGGRGIGKTYSVLEHLLNKKEKFILIRRTTTEREFLRDLEFNPLNVFLDDGEFKVDTGKYIDKYIYNDEVIAYCTNLSTVGKIRGLDGRQITALFFDEFIPDLTEKRMTHEAHALFQLYESVNRNREFNDLPPLKLFLCANSNNIFSDIIDGFKLSDIFFNMRETEEEFKYIKSKRMFIGDIRHSPVSERKKNTYLYKLTEGTDFYNMALKNTFANDYRDYIGIPYQWKEYKPYVDIKNIHVLKHINKPLLVVTNRNRGTARKKYYRMYDFFKEYNLILSKHFTRKSIFFESSEIACLFEDFLIK